MRKIIFLLFFFLINNAGFCQEQFLITPITNEVLVYINHSWETLTRTYSNLKLLAADPKLHRPQPLIIYVSPKENLQRVTALLKTQIKPEVFQKIKIIGLPKDVSKIKEQGLLFLPHPYVVPGGRFNEMYGWDSYFIELGLLDDDQITLAKDMVENIIYEVKYYGTVLNANRTYYLQRSQPPLLTEMILAYYYKTQNKKWLAETLPEILQFYHYWTEPPRGIPGLGLSRYYAGGEGPVPEEDTNYYQKVLDYYKDNKVLDYDKNDYYDEKTNTLTPLFYKADRTVRESGFDISAKFGPFGAGILDYAPVDLNVLLEKMEQQISEIYSILKEPKLSEEWKKRAATRAKIINSLMWDSTLGYYFDYNYKNKSLRHYVYATTYYPLWAHIASAAQAKRVAENTPNLLGAGGLVTSVYTSQTQWDAPFGWAPLEYFAVQGLLNYHYDFAAKQIANRFIQTINTNYSRYHIIFEKYDVQNTSAETKNKIEYSYNTNEVGFGWTNGVYLELMRILKESNNSAKQKTFNSFTQLKQFNLPIYTKNPLIN